LLAKPREERGGQSQTAKFGWREKNSYLLDFRFSISYLIFMLNTSILFTINMKDTSMHKFTIIFFTQTPVQICSLILAIYSFKIDSRELT